MRKRDKKLFVTGFLYVFLLSANTYCIANLLWAGIGIFSFLISFLWTVNVKRVATSTIHDRLLYAIGAMCGGLLGVATVNTIKHFII